jgi:hypothetical protein
MKIYQLLFYNSLVCFRGDLGNMVFRIPDYDHLLYSNLIQEFKYFIIKKYFLKKAFMVILEAILQIILQIIYL